MHIMAVNQPLFSSAVRENLLLSVSIQGGFRLIVLLSVGRKSNLFVLLELVSVARVGADVG